MAFSMWRAQWCVSASLLLASHSLVWAANGDASNAGEVPQQLQGIGIVDKLGTSLSIQNLEFKDEAGQSVKLAQYFKRGKPVVIALVYYSCPNLCTLVLNGLIDGLKDLAWKPGDQFEVVAVSIDHRETPELAAKKKEAYLKEYGKLETAAGWHFLVGDQSNVKKLADEVGFGFKYNERDGQYAHGAGLFLATPEGKLSRTLYGIQFRATDLKLGLLEASNGAIGTIADRIMLFCYSFDPVTRRYSVVLVKVVQASSAGTVAFFGSYLAWFWRRQRRSNRRRSQQNVSRE